MSDVKKPVVLIVIDGFGYSESAKYNAITAAKSPTWDRIWRDCPHTLINTSGLAVGLPEGQMGNSEVGHMTLGAGRVVYQSYTRINKAIEDGSFFENSVYCEAIDKAVANNKAVHIMGLLSPGGVHSHEKHIAAMVDMAAKRGANQIYLHAFLDGRDVAPCSAEPSLQLLQDQFKRLGCGQIASIGGRFYAMDRDNRWDRVEAAYTAMVSGESEHQARDPIEALKAAYERGENDEFVLPTCITDPDGKPITIDDGDSLIFMNFRPDRARQISHAFLDEPFTGFARSRLKLGAFVQTTEYSADLDAPIAFPPQSLKNGFGEYLADQGRTQLRISETEKYAHVTFFFNGGEETVYKNEERILIPSPKVATYDLQPEMSAVEVTDKLVAAIKSQQFDAIICNFANCDQVGHTGVFEAAVQAVESVDTCLQRVIEAIQKVDGQALITADHGNVEEMFDESTNQPMTQHTTLPVPLVYVGPRALSLKDGGSLADIAPTLLALMALEQPSEMTGHNLALFD